MEVAPRAEEVPLGFEDLFLPGKEALLPAPASSMPPPPAAQRKTLGEVAICKTGDLPLRRTNARLGAKGRAHKPTISVEKAADVMVCRSIDIIEDGEDITEATLDKFETQFKDQVSTDVLAAMHALFKLDDPHIMSLKTRSSTMEASIARCS
ncbi:hypothetical protein ZWY2020_052398 [Hordeum vulgare]|nr:hypothetical protein ZWY2020_052398 [Hordeum vulgare]